jgi:CRP/FNR family transcriptional regulator, transcriptional activator FtrB
MTNIKERLAESGYSLMQEASMRADDIHDMKRLPLFQGVASPIVDSMLQCSYLQRFPAHVELVREGEPPDFLHVIVDGHVEVFSAYRERETTVAVLGAGQSFIVAAVILDRIYLKSARALTPARVLLIPAEAVRHAFSHDATFARCMAFELATAYRGVVKELKNQKLRTSLERLANWILAQDDAGGGQGKVELPFDKKVLASRLGMAPEVLSRSFAALQTYHVRVSGGTIALDDRDALIKLAHPALTIDDPVS